MDLNRVIEIDADSWREGNFLSIRWAHRVDRARDRQPNSNPDLEQDICILTHALALLS